MTGVGHRFFPYCLRMIRVMRVVLKGARAAKPERTNIMPNLGQGETPADGPGLAGGHNA